jgi:hypothetical protein
MDYQETDKEIKTRSRATAKYEQVGYYFYNSLLAVKSNGKWGFINEDEQLIISFQFCEKPIFEGDYARAYIAKHCCGLIDVRGNVIIPFEYDNVKPFDKEGYAQFEVGNYWGTIDRDGVKHISPKMKFQQIGNFVDSIAPAKIDTKWGLIDTNGNKITTFQYYEIEDCSNGVFYTRLNPKLYGYLKPDGTQLFQKWFERIDRFNNSNVAIFKEDTKYGISHINGTIITPSIYDDITWDDTNENLIASINGNTRILSPSGIILFEQNNEVPNFDVDFLERTMNWVLPGLTFYYRDTNFPINVEAVYKKGAIIRAGAFIDLTHKAQKPVSKIRFIVTSSHVARLFEIEDICRQNPKIERWRLSTLHYNSYFKIMDVYKVEEQYQIFLLHIPYKAISFFVNDTAFILNAGGTSEDTFVDMARQSFNNKMQLERLYTLDEPEWVERTYIPIGSDENGNLLPLTYGLPDSDEILAFYNSIRKLAIDTDEINRLNEMI